MEIELILAAIVGLITGVGGAGIWLGILQNKVNTNADNIRQLTTILNEHLKEFHIVSVKVATIETTCKNIERKIDKLNGKKTDKE
jgi:hypothetical protein